MSALSIKIEIPGVDLTFKYDCLGCYREELRINPGGVYAFYGEDGTCLYIGKSKTLHSRLRSHVGSEFMDVGVYVDVRFVQNPSERDIYETYLIMEFLPKFNKDKVYKPPKSPLLYDQLDEMYADMGRIDTLIYDVEDAIEIIERELKPPGSRPYLNNFDTDSSDMSDAFGGYLMELDYFYSKDNTDIEQELLMKEQELYELHEDKSHLKKSIEDIYVKLPI